MKEFVEYYKDGLASLRQQPVMLILASAASSILPFLVVGVPVCGIGMVAMVGTAAVNKDLVPLALFPIVGIGMIVFAAAYNALRVGWTLMVIKHLNGEQIAWGDFKEGFVYFFPFLLAMAGLGMAGGLIAMTFVGVPVAVFLAVRTAFTPFIIVDEGLGPIDAMKRSNDLVTGYSWQIAGFFALLMVAQSIGGGIPIVNMVLPPVIMAFFDLVLGGLYFARKNESER